jgi:hypothetical protein
MYYPGLAPRGGTIDDLAFYVQTELQQLSIALQTMQTPQVILAELHSVPERPRDGMVVFADGTNWNPGSGRGVYAYSSSAWVKL